MRVMILGGGAREHVLYEAIKRSPLVTSVIVVPGNAGIPSEFCRNITEFNITRLVALAIEEHIDLVVVGPEALLVAGIVDALQKVGILAFGPNAAAARLEGSKVFTKVCCRLWGIPTARFEIASTYADALYIIKHTGFNIIKADGLCGGKGVYVIDAEDDVYALSAAHKMLIERVHGDAGAQIVIEEQLKGDEVSVMAFCDGVDAVLLPTARDYKRLGEDDGGPNTGGMGSYAPVPYVGDWMLTQIKDQIILPTLRGMAERGTLFHGLLYAGIMLTEQGPKLLEYNVRFGDPEAQVVLPLLESDIVPYLLACCKKGGLTQLGPLQVKPGFAVCTNLVSRGYPDKYNVGFPISGISEASRHALVYHGGTERARDGSIQTSAGRVMSVVGCGGTLAEARERSLQAADTVKFEWKFYRRDIARSVE